MAHKTLISGTAYSVTGGRELIGGTGYGCKAGKTLIGGTAFTIPFAKDIPLSNITPGAILYLNESGSPVPFYIAEHDYESGLNGAGRTLLVRKDCAGMFTFSAAIGITKVYYTPGNGNTTVAVLQRKAFQLSLTELGESTSGANAEGSELAIANTLKTTRFNGYKTSQWTRTPDNRGTTKAWYISNAGKVASAGVKSSFGARPAFTLPATLALVQNPDGTYTLAA